MNPWAIVGRSLAVFGGIFLTLMFAWGMTGLSHSDGPLPSLGARFISEAPLLVAAMLLLVPHRYFLTGYRFWVLALGLTLLGLTLVAQTCGLVRIWLYEYRDGLLLVMAGVALCFAAVPFVNLWALWLARNRLPHA